MNLANWFAKELEELDEDYVDDAAAIEKLQGMIARTFAAWRLETGYGLEGPGTDPGDDA
jgi:hypothetical protein